MEELLFDLREQNDWIKNRFPNKDLVSLESLLVDYEDLILENEHLNEEIRDLEDNIRDNYKPIDPYTLYGVSEKDFH